MLQRRDATGFETKQEALTIYGHMVEPCDFCVIWYLQNIEQVDHTTIIQNVIKIKKIVFDVLRFHLFFELEQHNDCGPT